MNFPNRHLEAKIEEPKIVNDGYDPSFYSTLFSLEDRHFWFRARNEIIADIVRQARSNARGDCHVLEIGCGTGYVLRRLKDECLNSTLVGIDLYEEGLAYAKQRSNCSIIRSDVRHPPFGVRFDLVGCFDVLEHIDDDESVLTAIRSLVTDDGTLVVTVPARRDLWSYFDRAAHHCRRYEINEIRTKLNRAGFKVEYLSYFMATIFPIVWMGRRLSNLRKNLDDRSAKRDLELALGEFRIVPVLNELLYRTVGWERLFVRHKWMLPIGTSILAVARTPVSDG